MHKHMVFFSNLIIIFLIIIGFTVIEYNDAIYYQSLAKKQIENDVSLAMLNISEQLENYTFEQRTVSQTIANDMFLKKWIAEEESSSDFSVDVNNDHAANLYHYLKNYQLTYDYDVVFFVSSITGNYYYQDGFNKVVSKDNHFDNWYYNFLNLPISYDIQIDRSETNNFDVTLFINYKVKDNNGNVIGVIGNGRHISGLQADIKSLQEKYGLNISLINIGNAHNSYTGKTQYFKTAEALAKELDISPDIITKNYSEKHAASTSTRCIAIQHINDLNWNIVVEKDIDSLMETFLRKLYNSLFFIIVIISILVALCTTFLTHINHSLIKIQNTDELTGLPNNRIFKSDFDRILFKSKFFKKDVTLFMLDIDDFKHYNDSHGHLYGNAILKYVANLISSSISGDGICARWGGDEFIGIYYGTPEEVNSFFNHINEALAHNEYEPISLSVGIAYISSAKTSHSCSQKHNLAYYMNLADEALYKAKDNGKGCCKIYSE
ncbi:diguanylate cyclase (GGDEF) domain-containing protein [Lachnospiraceae bacterium C7]|nr:diguanylate cyclase (GGDEF) domain-containing protein [Lachnospiraceae bacterium C7]